MARPRYTIQPSDWFYAWSYLGTRVGNRNLELLHDQSYSKASRDFDKVHSVGRDTERAKALNAWAEQYLTRGEWLKLKLAIRKRRQRWASSDQTATITISRKAHEKLSYLAKREQVTLTQALEKLLKHAGRIQRR